MAAITSDMTNGHVIQPIAFLRGRTRRPLHFAFASATRVGPKRERTVGSVLYLTHRVRVGTLERHVAIASLEDPTVPLDPPVARPPVARFFPASGGHVLGTLAYTDSWSAWDARVSAGLVDLNCDYAIIRAVSAFQASDLVVAILRELNPNDLPGISAAIRTILTTELAVLTPKQVTRALDDLGFVGAAGANRRLACERVLLVLLARAFAGPTLSAVSPTPTGIDKFIRDTDLRPMSTAAAVVHAAVIA